MMCHKSSLALAALGDEHRLHGRAAVRAERLDALDQVHAIDDFAENDIHAVEPACSALKCGVKCLTIPPWRA